MRAGLEVFARRWWSGEVGPAGAVLTTLTAPLSWAWSGGSALNGLRHELRRPTRIEGLDVISVGNLAVGGTGKTPMVAWIAATLREAGAAPAILVGGSGRDEALLHTSRLPDVPVLVNRDRVQGARGALREGAGVVILDDGFQHRRLVRDLDVVLLAAEDAFPGHVLPRGPYRERAGALARADVILVTRRSSVNEASQRLAVQVEAMHPGKVMGELRLAPQRWTDLEGRPVAPPRGDVLAVCAIARPAVFRSAVALEVTGSAELVAFADHHEYTPADVTVLARRSAGRPLAITEKDAVKLRAHVGTPADTYVLCEDVVWDWGESDFACRLRDVCTRGSRP